MKLFAISTLLTIVGVSIASPVVERMGIEKRQGWNAQAASCEQQGGTSFCCTGPLQPGGGSSGLLGGLNLGLLPLTCSNPVTLIPINLFICNNGVYCCPQQSSGNTYNDVIDVLPGAQLCDLANV